MKILLLALLMTGFCTHDIQIAFFKIHRNNDNLSMEIIMEKEDVEHTFKESDIDLTDANFKNYLNQNLSLLINKEKQELCLDRMQINEKHISMTCDIYEVKDKIQSIDLQNTCLLNIDNHSNIIEFRIDDTERDFLMNEKRTTISIFY